MLPNQGAASLPIPTWDRERCSYIHDLRVGGGTAHVAKHLARGMALEQTQQGDTVLERTRSGHIAQQQNAHGHRIRTDGVKLQSTIPCCNLDLQVTTLYSRAESKTCHNHARKATEIPSPMHEKRKLLNKLFTPVLLKGEVNLIATNPAGSPSCDVAY